jgi:hypothetical protein
MTQQSDTLSSLDVSQALAAAGPIAGNFEEFWSAVWRQPHISPRQLDLCRLLLARMHRADAEITRRHPAAVSDGITEAQAKAVLSGNWADSAELSPADIAILNFCEYYGLDPQSITDDYADAVKTHVGEPGLVALVEALGCIDSRIRLALMYRVLGAPETH